MSVRLIFRDNQGNTLHEKALSSEGTCFIPGQGDFLQIPGGEPIMVASRHFAYSYSESGQAEVQVILTCKEVTKPTGCMKLVSAY